MRLVNTATIKLHEFFGETVPLYAILSHRWETEEVTFEDLRDGKGNQMAGWGKVVGCCERAALEGWKYVWIDSCCINKTSSAELAEAINSMFAWYQGAQVCYAYLSDVPTVDENPYDDHSCFRQSKWFTRGWTLQEIIAPAQVAFFDREWRRMGSKIDFKDLIQLITGITLLLDYKKASVAQIMSWASKRETTRLEDQAYCLLGLFNLQMPLLYGEGSNAFLRLQQAILSRTDDDSIFAWQGHGDGGLLAHSPMLFAGTENVVKERYDSARPPHTMTSKGLGLEVILLSPETFECVSGEELKARVLVPMNCKRLPSTGIWSEKEQMALALYQDTESTAWRRESQLVSVPVADYGSQSFERTRIYVTQTNLGFGNNKDLRPKKRFRQPLLRIIDWRRQICQFLNVGPESTDDTILEGLDEATEKLEIVDRQAADPSKPDDLIPRYQVIHRVRCVGDRQVHLYIGEPVVVSNSQQGYHLRSNEAIYDLDHHLERNKSISFIIYKDYACCDTGPQRRRMDKSVIPHKTTLLTGEAISIVSLVLCSALTALAKKALDKIPHPNFIEIDNEFQSPYLWWYFGREKIAQAKKSLEESYQSHVSLFEHYLEAQYGATWSEVDYLLLQGKISAQYIEYLYVPNMILITRSDKDKAGQEQAYLAESWVTIESRHCFQSSNHNRLSNFSAFVDGTSWKFNGAFYKESERLPVGNLPTMTESFDIVELMLYPIKYAVTGIEDALRARGKKFWECRRPNYVCYSLEPKGVRGIPSPRFMIDMATYNLMHPSASETVLDELGPDAISRDKPPVEGSFLLCLPSSIRGFDLEKQLWTDLDVNGITPVQWTTNAFNSLLISEKTKEIILALVTTHTTTKDSRYMRPKRGDGVKILLHGGPGTGKSLTAECVAELLRRPLYKVSIGDLGTTAADMERYLEVILLLGVTWNCVVVLRDADTFFEHRPKYDLHRNVMASVFLRILDNFPGIVILTTNNIEKFDEASKSRIHVFLQYHPLEKAQRIQIWAHCFEETQLFSSRLVSEFEPSVQLEIDLGIAIDEVRAKLPEIAEIALNGRQIRNSFYTARQLAIFREEQMGYKHIEAVLSMIRTG